MDTSGTAPPIVYTLNRKSYVSVVSSGLTSTSAGTTLFKSKFKTQQFIHLNN